MPTANGAIFTTNGEVGRRYGSRMDDVWGRTSYLRLARTDRNVCATRPRPRRPAARHGILGRGIKSHRWRMLNGRAVFEMEADERHSNPMGTLHGGIYIGGLRCQTSIIPAQPASLSSLLVRLDLDVVEPSRKQV